MRDGRRQLGRIEHDGVEGPALGQEAAQAGVDVGVEEGRARQIETVELEVAPPARAPGPRSRSRSRWSAAGQRRDAETAGVAEAVEHLIGSRSGARSRPSRHGCRARDSSRSCGRARRRGRASSRSRGSQAVSPPPRSQPFDLGQALERACAGVAALVELPSPVSSSSASASTAFQRSAPQLLNCATRMSPAIHHQARQAVGLAVHQAHAVVAIRSARAARSPCAALPESGGDALALVEAPDARGCATWANRRPRPEGALGALDAHGFAGIPAAPGDGAVECHQGWRRSRDLSRRA